MDTVDTTQNASAAPVEIKTEPPDVPDGSLEPEINLQEESRHYTPNEAYAKNSIVYITHQLAGELDDDQLLPDCGSEELERTFSVDDTKDVFYKLSPHLICQDAGDVAGYSVIARCEKSVPTHLVKRLVKKAASMLPLSCFLRAIDADELMVMRIRSVKAEGTQQPVFVITHRSAPRSSFSDRPVTRRLRRPVAVVEPTSPIPESPMAAGTSKDRAPSTSQPEKRTVRPSGSGSSSGVARIPCDPKNPPQLQVPKETLSNGVPFPAAPLYHIAHRRRCSKIRRNAQNAAAANQDPTKINHTCGECFKKFTSYKVYLVHLHFHVNGRFRCEQCGVVCDSRREGVRHLGQHDATARPLLCSVCGDDSHRNLQDFLVHSLSHDDRFPKRTTCGVCGASVHRFLLHRHLLQHHSIRKFSCKHCGHAYNSKPAMERHVAVVHERAKRYACDLCDRAYSQKCSLDYHVRTHSENRRPFRCDMCSRAFPAKIALLLHKRKRHFVCRGTRHRRYPVVCMSCGDASANMLELQMHTCRNRLAASFSAALASKRPIDRLGLGPWEARDTLPREERAQPPAPPVAKVSAEETLAQKMLLNLRSAIGSAIAKGGTKS
ncbi:unnamed protein product [Ixodes hexagonus]